jgi:Protein of unknown function (DUF2829)
MTLHFSDALLKLQDGKRMSRTGWNGKDMWVQLQTLARLAGPTFILCTVARDLVVWCPSQTDLLATDWEEV